MYLLKISTTHTITSLLCMQITVQGYAVSGGGRGIERVDVSFDGGKTWVEASRYQRNANKVQYISDASYTDRWAWVLFTAHAEVSADTEIVAKAVSKIMFLWFLADGTVVCKNQLGTSGMNYSVLYIGYGQKIYIGQKSFFLIQIKDKFKVDFFSGKKDFSFSRCQTTY